MSPSHQHQALLQRIHRRFQTSSKTLEIGPLRLEFTCIANPDRVLDEVAAEEDRREKMSGHRVEEPLHLPYWAEMWDSAAGLGQFLTREKIASTARILDLGCGMGLAGTVAAALGGNVLFADLESPALLFARLNNLGSRDRVGVRRLNWQTDRLDRQFDLILGADILYERKQWEFLEKFWRVHLAPEGSILLGEPGRQTGELFIPWISQRGWRMEEFKEPVATREKPIRIFRLHA